MSLHDQTHDDCDLLSLTPCCSILLSAASSLRPGKWILKLLHQACPVQRIASIVLAAFPRAGPRPDPDHLSTLATMSLHPSQLLPINRAAVANATVMAGSWDRTKLKTCELQTTSFSLHATVGFTFLVASRKQGNSSSTRKDHESRS